MARSRRKTPIFGIACAKSEKLDKRIANRRFRANEKEALRRGRELPTKAHHVSDVWSFSKDGKRYREEAPEEWMRK
jgi:hypothetical protein